jgi:hypothetical protein
MEKKIRELIEKYDIKIREENLYHTPLWDFIQDLEWLLEEESWEDLVENIDKLEWGHIPWRIPFEYKEVLPTKKQMVFKINDIIDVINKHLVK